MSILDTSNNELLYFFLNKCNININNLQELHGLTIERDLLLNISIYNELKIHIPNLKSLLKTSICTSTQKNAEIHQKWPLLNLIRQLLKNKGYKLEPKRISNGYNKEGKKLYKRLFIIEKINF